VLGQKARERRVEENLMSAKDSLSCLLSARLKPYENRSTADCREKRDPKTGVKGK